MRAITWAVRVTFAAGRTAFLRQGGVTGSGPIVTFHSQATAEAQAASLRQADWLDAQDVVTVIERSHGRLAALGKEQP